MGSSNPTTGYLAKGNENKIFKRYPYPHIHFAALFTITYTLKQPKRPAMDE